LIDGWMDGWIYRSIVIPKASPLDDLTQLGWADLAWSNCIWKRLGN